MWTISLPLKVNVSKKRTFLLNLNQYRNTHFQVLNKAKTVFEEVVRPLLKDLPILEECTFDYVLYPGTAHLSDISNICCVVDKFFSDTLVSVGKLPDDNYTVLKQVNYRIGSIDKANPRVDVTIHSLKEINPMIQEEQDMDIQVTMVQTEIEDAIRASISNHMTLKEGTQISIDMVAARGADGFKAVIKLTPPGKDEVKQTGSTAPVKEAVKKEVAKATDTKPVAVEDDPKVEGESTAAVDATTGTAENASDEAKPEDTAATAAEGEADRPRLFGNLKRVTNS